MISFFVRLLAVRSLFMPLFYPYPRASRNVQTHVFSGSHTRELANGVAQRLGLDLADFKIGKFSDGEISIDMGYQLYNSNVLIIQSTQPCVNDSLMELLLMVSTAKRAGAHTITAVVPYLCYSRQTDKPTKGSPISSADVALMLESVGLQRLITLDIHSVVSSGFYNQAFFESHLVHSIAVKYFASLNLTNVVIVAPDAGAQKRAINFTNEYNTLINNNEKNANTVLMYKTRHEANKVDTAYVTGPVNGMNAIFVDDMIDTAGTIVKAAELLKEMGTHKIYVFATHGIFSGPALSRLENSEFEKIVTTNSIPQPEAVLKSEKIEVLDVSDFLANLLKQY